jgi:hypothetical protein
MPDIRLDVDAGQQPTGTDDLIRRDWLSLPLDRVLTERLGDEVAAHGFLRILSDDDLSRLGQVQHAGCMGGTAKL